MQKTLNVEKLQISGQEKKINKSETWDLIWRKHKYKDCVQRFSEQKEEIISIYSPQSIY